MVTREFPPVSAYTGGIGRQFAALAGGLAAQGHEIVVLLVGTDGRLERRVGEVRVRGVGPARLAGGSTAGAVAAARTVDRALAEEAPFDAVYAPEWGGDAALYGRRKRAGPLVTGLHMGLMLVRRVTPDTRRLGGLRPRRMVQRGLERAQAERSDAIIAPTRAVLALTRESWDIDRLPTALLPNCVDVAPVLAASRGPLPAGFPQGDPVVAFSGRLEGRKGVQVLVRAMRAVWEARPEVRLALLGGDGAWHGAPMSDHLRAIAGPFAGRLAFLGGQPPERLFPALVAADVVALPSLWENFPLAALEAMALGCPLVATGGSGYDDFVAPGESGVLVPPGDPGELARALLDLLADEPRRRRLGAAAARAAEGYGVERVARQHAEFMAGLSS